MALEGIEHLSEGRCHHKGGRRLSARLHVTFEYNSADMGLFEKVKYEDYKTAFKQEPPSISGIAIMTDSDNTGESATAFYGDIIFKNSKISRGS